MRIIQKSLYIVYLNFNNRVILIHVEFRDNTVDHAVSAWRAAVLARKEFRLCTCVRVLLLTTSDSHIHIWIWSASNTTLLMTSSECISK